MPRGPRKRGGPSAPSMYAKKTKRRRKGTGTKVKAVATGYFNNTDPYRVYATKKEATDEGVRLRKITEKKRSARVPTFYTILQDKRKGVRTRNFPSKPQGPHTIPHYFILDALIYARENNILEEVADLRLTPSEFKKIVNTEIKPEHKKRPRALVAIKRYRAIYEKGDMLLGIRNPTEEEEIKTVHTINKALQLGPYQTYSYKGTGASKTATMYKGELRGTPVVMDFPHTAGFADNAATRSVLEDLLTRLREFQRPGAEGPG